MTNMEIVLRNAYTLENFQEDLTEVLTDKAASNGLVAKFNTVEKTNGSKYCVTFLESESMNVMSPIIYIEEDAYQKFLKNHDLDAIAEEIFAVYQKNKGENADEIKNLFTDFNFVKQLLHKKVVNKDWNKKMLEDSIWKEIPNTDLAYVAYVDMSTITKTTEKAYTLIKKEHLSQVWNVSEDEIWENVKDDEIVIESMFFAMMNMMGEFVDDEMLTFDDTENKMFIVTNKEKLFGASVISNKDFAEKVQQGTGLEKFLVIPSSVHEVLVIPYDEMTPFPAEMIQEVNEETVPPEERLGNYPYLYDGEKLQILK